MAEYDGKPEQKGAQAQVSPDGKVQAIEVEHQGEPEVQTLVNTQSLQTQLSDFSEMGATEEGVAPDLLVDAPQHSKAKPTPEPAAANDTALGANGLPPGAPTKIEIPEDGSEGGAGTTEISSDSVTCASPATTVTAGQKPREPCAAQDSSAGASKQGLSDMPPPSFLPRQLRMKRNSCGVAKVAATSFCRTQIPATASDARSTSASSTDGTVRELGGARADAEAGQQEGTLESSTVTSATLPSKGSTDDEFFLFMKEIQELDSQREGEQHADRDEAQPAPSAAPQHQQVAEEPLPSSQVPQETLPACGASELPQQQQAGREAVGNAPAGKAYNWKANTDEVTREMTPGFSDIKTPLEESRESEQGDLERWAASTFKRTQQLQTSTEKVRQLLLQLDFIEDELDAMYDRSTTAQPAPTTQTSDVGARLERFRTLKQQRERQRQRRSQEAKAACSDDELLKELIDLQLQQDQQPGATQCARCRQLHAERRGTQPQQAEIRALASSLARRLGNVEKEWAAAMLAALKARLDDWIDGGLGGDFFLQRLQKMQQDLQRHLAQGAEAEGRQQDLASVFPYSAAAAMASASAAGKPSPRNCLASAAAAAAFEKAGTARRSSNSKSAAAALPCGNKCSEETQAAPTAPPTPAGPPPTLPDEVSPAAADAVQGEAAAAADSSRHRDIEAPVSASRDGAQTLATVGKPGRRTSSGGGSRKLTSSNPLVRKRMQLVERWQRSREKDDSEEEDYEQRKERLKQRKLDEWKEREMASHRGMKNANFIELAADWRSLVEKN